MLLPNVVLRIPQCNVEYGSCHQWWTVTDALEVDGGECMSIITITMHLVIHVTGY